MQPLYQTRNSTSQFVSANWSRLSYALEGTETKSFPRGNNWYMGLRYPHWQDLVRTVPTITCYRSGLSPVWCVVNREKNLGTNVFHQRLVLCEFCLVVGNSSNKKRLQTFCSSSPLNRFSKLDETGIENDHCRPVLSGTLWDNQQSFLQHWS